jgi:hypothetical protein
MKAAAVIRSQCRSFSHMPVQTRHQDPSLDAIEQGYMAIATKCAPFSLRTRPGNLGVPRLSFRVFEGYDCVRAAEKTTRHGFDNQNT